MSAVLVQNFPVADQAPLQPLAVQQTVHHPELGHTLPGNAGRVDVSGSVPPGPGQAQGLGFGVAIAGMGAIAGHVSSSGIYFLPWGVWVGGWGLGQTFELLLLLLVVV